MTDLSDSGKLVYKARHKIRFVTAASLFDGHDASINIMRRILQASGAEVIHLGHNRSVEDIVTAALQEDVQGVAISSYQGGHLEYFKYMVDLLRERGGGHIKVFGGGGGVIVAEEIKDLEAHGVTRIYSPEDGQRMGLQGMINDMLARCDFDQSQKEPKTLAQTITALELGVLRNKPSSKANSAPVLGITGTGGAGKSSLTDELVRRFRLDQGDGLKVAINKFDRRGAEDALRDVRKQLQRNRQAFGAGPDSMPVFGTIAARFNDDGVSALYHALAAKLTEKGLQLKPGSLPKPAARVSTGAAAIVPPQRSRYLAEISESVRGYHGFTAEQAKLARERQQLSATRSMLGKEIPEITALLENKV